MGEVGRKIGGVESRMMQLYVSYHIVLICIFCGLMYLFVEERTDIREAKFRRQKMFI